MTSLNLKCGYCAWGKHSITSNVNSTKDRTPPVQFEITQKTKAALQQWIAFKSLYSSDYLFGSRVKADFHLSTRQYARIVKKWIARLGCNILRHSFDEAN